MDIRDYLKERAALVDRALEEALPPKDAYPGKIHDAMHYSVFAGGKRLRPALCLAACEVVGGEAGRALPAACAMEIVHTYSLIHDDLPCMDDDDLRRGKPTNHKVYGEGIAVLAGDALLTEAFSLLARVEWPHPYTTARAVRALADSAGSMGLVGGQVVDLESEGREVDAGTLSYIHTHKTAALIRVSVVLGAMAGGAEEDRLRALSAYGEKIGLAFQIMDDVLDLVGEEEKMGKRTGHDARSEKATWPGLYGLDASRKGAEALVEEAVGHLEAFGPEADPLRAIARFIATRES